jgi:HlyD family secretion protein
MSVRRTLLLLFVSILGMIAFVIVSARQQARANVTPSLANYQQYVVARGDVAQVVSAIGSVEADQTLELAFPTAGRIAEVYVKPGDYMFAGEPLVRLENEAQRLTYEQAQLALEKAQLQLETALQPVSQEDLDIAQAAVDSAWGSYLSLSAAVTDDDIRAAELAYEQQLNTYNDLKAARDQAPGGYGGPTYNTLDAQTGAASFNAEIARLQLEALRTGNQPAQYAAYARVLLAQAEYDRTAAGPTTFEIDSAALAVRSAESQLRRAESAYNRTTLVAPFDGLVSTIAAEVGGLVAPGVPQISLTDVQPLRLTVEVDEVDVRLVAVEAEAEVELDALRDVVIPAKVEQVSLIGDSESGIVNYDVELTIDADDPRVRVGMTAEANIIADQRENVLVIPNLYIRLDRSADRAFVNILRDGVVEEVEVQLGLQGQDASEVISGLREGDVIVVDTSGDGLSSFF